MIKGKNSGRISINTCVNWLEKCLLTHEFPQQHHEETGAVAVAEQVVDDSVQRLLLSRFLVEPLLEALDALAPLDRSRRVLLADELGLADHPSQRDVAHLEGVLAELATVRLIAVNDALFWIDNSYRSVTAASLTVEVLRRIQTRMPRLQEIILVPRDEESMDGPGTAYLEPTMVHVRMAGQIQTAITTLCHQTQNWNPPRWSIQPLSAFPSPKVRRRPVPGWRENHDNI